MPLLSLPDGEEAARKALNDFVAELKRQQEKEQPDGGGEEQEDDAVKVESAVRVEPEVKAEPMPLLSLPDDCLGEIAGWLPARDAALSFRTCCKVLRDAVWEGLVDEAVARELPFAAGLGRGAARRAFGELGRVGSAGYKPAGGRRLRTLDEFRFLVAASEFCDPDAAQEPAVQLEYVEYEPSLGGNGSIQLPVREPVIWPDDDGISPLDNIGCSLPFNVVVVDTKTGKMEKLVAAPLCVDYFDSDGEIGFQYEFEQMPGCTSNSQVRTICSIVCLSDCACQSISIEFEVNGDEPAAASDEQLMHAIAGMFL
ncbi:hypothetical protein TeGR_g5255 [Tetraparma gracilis]|uniref:F-box domain-containing protein n=1 Tax=Tetraparma gracilis TaxID=2962635 RepID=A0ABQ6M4Y2_9STRA|nr:hypothetical protein TeGR_g5255 [Tetraparma gracilis]